jgi:hypothetical protein
MGFSSSDVEGYHYSYEARIQAAVGAVLTLGGTLLYRSKKSI